MPNIKQAEIQYAAAAKPLQLCPTLCDPIDGSPPGSPVPGILQARTLEWVAISFSNALKWSRSVLSNSWRPHVLQPTRLLHPWDFPGKSTGVGCQCLLLKFSMERNKSKSCMQQLSPNAFMFGCVISEYDDYYMANMCWAFSTCWTLCYILMDCLI